MLDAGDATSQVSAKALGHAPESLDQLIEGSEQQERAACRVDLSAYSSGNYSAGRGPIVRALWYVISLVVFESGWVPLKRIKVGLLRLFGARLGRGVVIKPNVRIKHPWYLEVGDHSWIGQEAWIDNLADVRIGSNVCISQRAYLCTGSHDHRLKHFDLIVKPITIDDGAWLAAGSIILQGVRVGAGSIVCAGCTIRNDVPAETIHWGVGSKPRMNEG